MRELRNSRHFQQRTRVRGPANRPPTTMGVNPVTGQRKRGMRPRYTERARVAEELRSRLASLQVPRTDSWAPGSRRHRPVAEHIPRLDVAEVGARVRKSRRSGLRLRLSWVDVQVRAVEEDLVPGGRLRLRMHPAHHDAGPWHHLEVAPTATDGALRVLCPGCRDGSEVLYRLLSEHLGALGWACRTCHRVKGAIEAHHGGQAGHDLRRAADAGQWWTLARELEAGGGRALRARQALERAGVLRREYSLEDGRVRRWRWKAAS